MNAYNETKYISPNEKKELLEVMDNHYQTYLRARSLTPFLDKTMIDRLLSCKTRTCFDIPTSTLYQSLGYDCRIVLNSSQFDTKEKCQQYQDIGHWINQSFFIELKCILDTFINWKDNPSQQG